MADLKLFYAPGACSLASHIALEEAGADFEAVRVDFRANEQRSPGYLAINPKGRVPALVVGEDVITENPAILRYVARAFPQAGLWPSDALDDARCAEWLAFLSSSVHPSYAHIRRPERYASDEAGRQDVVATGLRSAREFWEMVERKLEARSGQWAMGGDYSVVDPYLLVFWTWGNGSVLAYDMAADFPAWTAHARQMTGRPAVRRVFEREGLTLPA
ncbi:glutathione S-transferase family protein [Jiella marina]|uniref:glutathione S-transferase family protein n=1 Tax=Jiella sp. LLJ827 TaxID=2917712 RepID=UPI002100BF16|nr:glutathione S-transferase [Jiella sp. LLJ827]MCQ0988436.1 glutathione S-transferase N-terminal domain-containing protein [Jiella sp. LLJ827]